MILFLETVALEEDIFRWSLFSQQYSLYKSHHSLCKNNVNPHKHIPQAADVPCKSIVCCLGRVGVTAPDYCCPSASVTFV